MRKIMVVLCCIIGTSAFAQNGFFLQPTIGAGSSYVNYQINDANQSQPEIKPIMGKNLTLGVGYQMNRLSLASGLGYTQTGGSAVITYTDALGNPIGTGSYIHRYSSIIVPLAVGFRFGFGKFSVTPQVGAELSYTFSETDITKGLGNTQKMIISGSEYNKSCKPFCVYGMAAVNFEYKVSDRLSLVAAPKGDYMINNMFKTSYATQHLYSLGLNAGVKWMIKKPAKAGTK